MRTSVVFGVAKNLQKTNIVLWAIDQLRNEKNSRDFIISKLVKGIKSKSSLIFFDEFQVTNIADAMILGHLFEEFFKNNILIVLTSNTSPETYTKRGCKENFLSHLLI